MSVKVQHLSRIQKTFVANWQFELERLKRQGAAYSKRTRARLFLNASPVFIWPRYRSSRVVLYTLQALRGLLRDLGTVAKTSLPESYWSFVETGSRALIAGLLECSFPMGPQAHSLLPIGT